MAEIPALLVAAPASGCGKTTVTLALLAALKRRGLAVAPFKVGPDYIDPGHHAAVCGRPSRNLDGWMCGQEEVRRIFEQGCEGADIAVIEGVMGLFDGAAPETDEGSSAEIARRLGASVLLVVDARSQARSAAALVSGFAGFDPRLPFAGVLFNRVGSERHAEFLTGAMASRPELPKVLGCLSRDEELSLPSRHLGLVTAEDGALDDATFTRLADWLEAGVDLEALLAGLPRVAVPDAASSPVPAEKKVRIGVARDRAFCFYYPENLEMLAAAGAELVFFSPLTDEHLPEGLDGLYLGGGYPELHADALSGKAFLSELKAQLDTGLPVYAECGGFMLLCEAIEGRRLAGIFPAEARMLPRRRALGYRQVELAEDCLLGPRGTVLRGHEFHYSEALMPESVSRVYRISRRGDGELPPEGYRVGNVLGSYVHLHFGSCPEVAGNFVEFCRKVKAEKSKGGAP